VPDVVVSAQGLRKVFTARHARAGESEIVAVDNVSFEVPAGGSLAIVGESGSGKTTVARMLVGLERPTAGTILIAGRDRTRPSKRSRDRRARGRDIQIVFQDPYSSLDPRQTAAESIEEALKLHFALAKSERNDRVRRLADQVGLDERQIRARPRALSGGQRQRVAIARALAAEPKALVLDESVASLDVSIQAQILNLLAEIREQTGIAYVFISHDLAVVRQVTDEALVMQRGRLVERGPTEQILDHPEHQYTKVLRSSVPTRGWKPARRAAREGHPA
jgi:peptide/nickel transport system ATP-binding protein